MLSENLRRTQNGFLCDRTTPLGNPFILAKGRLTKSAKAEIRSKSIEAFRLYLYLVIFKDYEVSQAIAKVAIKHNLVNKTNTNLSNHKYIGVIDHFTSRLELIKYLRELRVAYKANPDLKLLCWCSPLDCHTKVIINLLIYLDTLTYLPNSLR
jgi:hypothetical protein